MNQSIGHMPQAAPSGPHHRPRQRRDPLITATCIIVILAVVGWAFETVREKLAAAAAAARATAAGPQAGKLEELAYTSGEAAHVTVTNLNPYPVQSCFKAIVEGAEGSVESVPVCTGELKPKSTTVLVAPYHVGAVEKLCEGEPDRFGNRHLDWSRCTFTTRELK